MEHGTDLETWENATESRVVLQLRSAAGELAPQMIGAHKTFHLTPQERRINQERSANVDQDPFLNGLLVPVRLIEDEEDTAAIASSPNHLGEAEMVELLKGNYKAFEKRLAEVTNGLALQRLFEIAERVDASVSKVNAVRARLMDVAPSLVAEVTTIGKVGTIAHPVD